MPLGRKHLRRNRDAPNVGWTIQRTASNLSATRREVNVPKELDATGQDEETRGSAVRQSSDIAQAEQFGVGRGQGKTEHFGGGGQKSVGGITLG